MKRLAILLTSLVMLCGCTSVPPQALEQVRNNAVISDAFIALMEKGETSRDQEQAFIHANRRNWHALNFAINEDPLPEDMSDEAPRDGNLLESLEKDPEIRAMINKVRDVIQPEPDGN